MIGASFQISRVNSRVALLVVIDDMDVPYNKSGASSREHYQVVRNVENAPHQTEHLVRQEVQRIRQRVSGKVLSAVSINPFTRCLSSITFADDSSPNLGKN